MNAPDRFTLPDIQSQHDARQLPIEAVGVRGLRYPVLVKGQHAAQASIAHFDMAVGLPGHVKGTHMSRFVELLEANTLPFGRASMLAMLADMLARLDAASGSIAMRFPYFVKKAAPVSGIESMLDIDARLRVAHGAQGGARFFMQVLVPATSLCPCSKQISAYGAHNQRSHIRIDVELKDEMSLEQLMDIAERSASCEVYGLLKRVDEKFVTERAYDNPKFVEDMVRAVALALNDDARIGAYSIDVENFESIHNHSAWASISRSA
ncbi:MAG: GTP cyclohydrolase FolE2 [Pseudomonadota bacterium]